MVIGNKPQTAWIYCRSLCTHLAVSVLSLLSILANAQPSEPCQCLWQGSFSTIVTRSDFIASGEVITTKGNSIDFKIARIMADRKINFREFNETIRIWGDDGKQCRPDISDFPVGSQWVMALKKITDSKPDGFNPNTPNISYGRINDYYLSKCGAYWLYLDEGYVVGNLVNGHRWEWKNEDMNPVRLELIEAYVKDTIPEQALIDAAKPLTEAKILLKKTKQWLRDH
jgi:hypothetical protein